MTNLEYEVECCRIDTARREALRWAMRKARQRRSLRFWLRCRRRAVTSCVYVLCAWLAITAAMALPILVMALMTR